MPRLTVTSGVDEGRQFELAGDATVGRDSTSAIRLFDTEVSRRHAELQFVEATGGYRILDRASANGLLVNGHEVRSAELRNGDSIQLGKTTLLYTGAPGEPVAKPPSDVVRLLNRPAADLPSAILRRVEPQHGSRILESAEDVRSDWLRTRLANLTILYEAVAAASHILDLERLLEKVLELLFGSVDADRGCILLSDGEGPPTPAAVRWKDGAGAGDEIAISRTIVEYVLTSGEGVLVADAGQDERFRGGQSVLRYGIREAICAPLDGRRGRLGVLYFDTFRVARPTTPAADAVRFTEDHLALAVAVARQAALAVEETRYYQAMVQSERLAAVGQAIAALSHHIKNILQGMKSGCEVLRVGLTDKDDAAINAGWRLLDKNQGRIFDLVMDMLSYSKDREPALEPTDLAKLVHEAVDFIRPRAAERGVTVTVECEPLAPVAVDPEGIHRGLLNLLTNALDAVEDSEAPRVDVRLSAHGGWVRVSVRDNGCGIEPEVMAWLFKPFESTKGSRGTGLGLAVSRKTMREHGGDIDVESRTGTGSTFTLRIPSGG